MANNGGQGATPNNTNKSLAQFVSEAREKAGFSQIGLAQRCNLGLEEIENIENGSELFLSSTTRQKLCKGLKMTLDEIKVHEKGEDFTFGVVPEKTIETIKDEILNGLGEHGEIACPNCGNPLVVRIAKLYDLEDNLMLHPKAICSKCPFQIK